MNQTLNSLSPDQLKLIAKPLPADAVKPHPTRHGMSSIKAIYVTERLNEVFGVGTWTLKTDLIPVGENGFPFSIKSYTTKNGQPRTEYFAVSKTILEIPSYGIHYECIAGASNDDMGDAAKGSATDAITKIASYLGIGIDVFKGQQDQAVKDYEQAERKAFMDAEVERAVTSLETCQTKQDLTNLRESLQQDIVRDKRFQKAALERFNAITLVTEQN
jgi:hypothetical protein